MCREFDAQVTLFKIYINSQTCSIPCLVLFTNTIICKKFPKRNIKLYLEYARSVKMR